MSRRSIREIALDIKKDWKKPYFGAVPYLNSLLRIDEASDYVRFEQGKTIIAGFLTNAQSWRGPVARAIKEELKKHYNEEKLVQEVEASLASRKTIVRTMDGVIVGEVDKWNVKR